jgi:hypothetical protein
MPPTAPRLASRQSDDTAPGFGWGLFTESSKMKMRSIARGPFKYAGVLVEPHAEFSVKSARDAKMLAAVKRAIVVRLTEGDALADTQGAPRPDNPSKEATELQKKKRTYKRRDMVAEFAAVVVAEPIDEESPPEDPAAFQGDTGEN